MAKKKTESNSSKKKKKQSMKKLLSASNSIAMKSKNPQKDKGKSNPFESIWSRRKFDILGKKRKGEERRIGLARSQAVEKRKKSLLKEYEQSSKSSVFVDKRIGERDDNLDDFGKAILRFQRERQSKLNKKSKYNLSDGEEDDFASLSKRDDFEDELSSDDDVDAKEKNSPILKQVSADDLRNPLESGPMEEEEKQTVKSFFPRVFYAKQGNSEEQFKPLDAKHKTKKEIMEEIILKSKFYKAQKAKDKEEDEHLLEQLDNDFTSLAQSEALLSLTRPGKINALKALLNKSSVKESKEGSSVPANQELLKQEKPDAYDRLVKEMVLDIRARPSDRTKTPEEIAQEEKERLEHLEEERQKRMLGADDSSDEGSDDDEDFDKSSLKKLKSISGDDLGDSFSLDKEQPKKTGWVDEILGRKNMDNLENEDGSGSEDSESGEDDSGGGEGSDEDENDQEEGSDEDENDQEEGSDEEDGRSSKISLLEDWERSDDDDIGTDLEEEEVEEEEEGEPTEEKGQQKVKQKTAADMNNEKTDSRNARKMQTSGKPTSIQHDSLPFVIEAPKSLEELQSLIDNRSDTEVLEAINRIRACNTVRLAAENRKKMQVFYGVLLQYFAVSANQKPLNFKLLNLLVKPLMEMSAETPYFAAICARQRILRIRTQFCEDVKNPEKSSWPSLKTLFLLRLWSMIFPCSDFRHVVMTPAILLMCEYLMRCPIISGQDIATGCFLCSMVLSVAKQSEKFCPEALLFIQTMLMSALETEPELDQNSQWYYFKELKAPKPWLRIHNHVHENYEIDPLDFLMVMNVPEDSAFFSSDNFRVSVLVSLIKTLRGFVNISEGLSSFPEIFAPFSALLHKLVEQEKIVAPLRDNMSGVAQLIEEKAGEHYMLRQPLQMRKQKPVPIKLLNPKFEENFVKGRDYDPDRERVEMKKLKRRIKREAKGAARELRKDNYFLSELKVRDKKLLEEERAEKYGKARAFLQEQEHAFKSGQLGKGRKRRR